MVDYAQYEKDCARIRKENKKLIEGFEKELQKSKISQKTIKNHCGNIECYLDNFLLYYEAISAAEGISEIGEYLGDFFIRKCMWSTPEQTKQTAASFKKFYSYLHSIGMVTDKALDEMRREIKIFLPDWIDAVRAYNDYSDDDGMW